MVAAQKRGDVNSAHCTTLRMVDDALDALAHDPIDKKYALSGSLSNIFRIKKGRMRICWLASSQKRKVTVLYISETPRKEGGARDPYKVFTNLVLSGQFDAVFDKLGVKRPTRRLSGALRRSALSAVALLRPTLRASELPQGDGSAVLACIPVG